MKNRPLIAYCSPFIVFALFLGLRDLIPHSLYWVFPLQTVVCAGIILAFWRDYLLETPKGLAWSLGTGLLVFGLWVSPQALFGMPPRLDGFDPTVFPPGSPAYWGTVIFRFLRMAVVVPFVEEIFWRGFLMRYLIREDFKSVPFGSFSWLSFGLVTLFFMLEHGKADYPAAFVTGILYNLVAIRTRSLSACVLAHAVTNLLLGFYIMATRQWGFW